MRVGLHFLFGFVMAMGAGAIAFPDTRGGWIAALVFVFSGPLGMVLNEVIHKSKK